MAHDPQAGYHDLALLMYERDDRSARGALSAEFSELKKLGLVQSPEKGKFQLTPLAARVLATQAGAID
jgi:restriction endonuclease Mrr